MTSALSAISFTSSYATSSANQSGQAPTRGLEFQVEKYKKELSECINCASAKTPEGKKAIAEASAKLHAAQTRLEKSQQANPNSSTTINTPDTPQRTLQSKHLIDDYA